MQKPCRISEAEWKVMDVIWRNSPITAAEVMTALADDKDWAANTVRTMLARLVRKGVLKYGQEANRYLYRPAVQREQCVQGEVDSLLRRVFGGAAQPLLVHFVANKKLSSDEIRELRKLLDQKEAEL
ncbi:MAG: BlaI/MecI/CopY family transcriptional regulator [Chthoniobacteraceae bacterium]|nr:BlaI/MecI/CopY family transcriptional regulator [Chthoniobacteraceae bacterium]